MFKRALRSLMLLALAVVMTAWQIKMLSESRELALGEEAPEVGWAEVAPGAGEARLLHKAGALLEVVGIGADGRLGGAAAVLEFGEKGVYGLVHGLMLHLRLLPYPRAGYFRDRVWRESGETGYI